MANETSQWTLNLDVTEALEHLNEFKGGMSGAFNTDSVSELLSKFAETGIALGLVAGAVLAVKTAMDLTFEGEKIEAINRQFETLSENAGIFGQDMKEALVKAAGGLADDTELIQAANKALVGLGDNAKKLPEIMETARKVTAVFGGDLMQNFGNITQAIESGNVRLLRHYGIIIDQKKAYEDYAKSIGVSANELSKSGQQAAISNAVLAQTKQSLAGVDVDMMQATNAFKEFKVAMSDMGETIALLFNKTLGPSVANFFRGIRDGANDVKNWIKMTFGEGQESAEGKVALLQGRIAQTQKTIQGLEAPTKSWMQALFPGDKQAALAQAKTNLAALNAQLVQAKLATQQYEAIKDQARNKDRSSDAAEAARRKVDLDKRFNDLLKFNQQVNQLRLQNVKSEISNAKSIEQVNKLSLQQQLLAQRLAANEIKKITKDTTLDKTQKNMMILQVNRKLEQELIRMEKEVKQERLRALDNYVEASENAADGVARAWSAGFQAAAEKAKEFGEFGKMTFQQLTQGAVDAFVAMADGSENAGEALKKHLLGALAQIAIQQGTVELLGSIYPPQPAGIAAGLALIALGGVLKGISGMGGGASTTPSIPSQNVGSPGPSTPYGQNPIGPSNLQQQPMQKTVNLTVQGNYYDTNEARTALMDMIRSSTDASDFNYYKVGGQ